jgi:Dolichyl-phosphate-mannose-protein mannosyltransferase
MQASSRAPRRLYPCFYVPEKGDSALREGMGGGSWVALALILVVAWLVRARDFSFSTAYMDESIYIVYGRMYLSHHLESSIDQPLRWSFGWYLWPAMAAIADWFGGLEAVRALGASLGVVTALAVFGFTRRLFSPAVGLAAAAAFALFAPAVFVSRIVTRDAPTLCFFALGLWAYARAWQENKVRDWLVAAACFFAAFLAKYIVAICFPILVLLALAKGRKAFTCFTLPLTILCATYGFIYADDLADLLSYGKSYGSLRANPGDVWRIYAADRADFWILAALALPAGFFLGKKELPKTLLLWLGAAAFLAFQCTTRADYDFWKHANYPALFLAPLALAGVVEVMRQKAGRNHRAALALVIVLFPVLLGWIGGAWRMNRFVFWPNVEPAVAILKGQLAPESRVLVDDSVFRYYFSPPLSQRQIADPFYFAFQGATGQSAYAAAVRDGFFDFIMLDGGIGGEARSMDATIRPELAGRYQEKGSLLEPTLGRSLEIFERQHPPAAKAAPSGPSVDILSPSSGQLVRTDRTVALLRGVVRGARPGSYVRVDVFTSRWYPQGERIFPDAADGSFSRTIYLGGEGAQQCHHLVRARLYDAQDQEVASTVVYEIARANPDGSTPGCRRLTSPSAAPHP